MADKTTCQFGLWTSPITPRTLAEERRLDAARYDTDGRTVVWLEGRSGKGVLVTQGPTLDAPRDLTSAANVRAEVSYGGGDFAVHGGFVYFVVYPDARIYRQPLAAGPARPLTPPFGKAASPSVAPDGRWVVYVHHAEDNMDRLAIVDTEGQHWPQIFAEGHDFYMQPRWSPDGRRVAWIAWNHPNMPWDGTELYLADVVRRDQGLPRLAKARRLAGGPETAIFQPEFTPDGRWLVYVSDETGWGRIAVMEVDSGHRQWVTPEGVEYGVPAWAQGMRTYAISHDGSYVIGSPGRHGFQQVTRINLANGESVAVEALAEYTEVSQLVSAPESDRIMLAGSGATTPPRIVSYDFTSGRPTILARSSGETIPPSRLARCEAVSWTNEDGTEAHGLYYPPANDRLEAIGKPPLMVMVHGGPTAQAKAGWRPDAQFFATRGFGVLYVNYRGSTGYGRAYMLQLRGKWGICDVEDAIGGSRCLAEAGKTDPSRTVIMGGSAGGFTVLQTMATHPEAFTAGICLYGVADQFHLAAETHKFEAHYLDTLLGQLPEAAQTYRERSPLFFAHRIQRPLAVFQGAVDHVVPREQSDAIVEALRRNGTPHVYHVYEGEGHGWRKRETIEHFYEAVEKFLRQYVVFA